MTSPLYSVGQHVAVCTSDLSVVIPATTVTGRVWDEPGLFMDWKGALVLLPAGWSYRVAAVPFNPRGTPHWFAERTLRPINPDTEYLSDSAPQKLEQPA